MSWNVLNLYYDWNLFCGSTDCVSQFPQMWCRLAGSVMPGRFQWRAKQLLVNSPRVWVGPGSNYLSPSKNYRVTETRTRIQNQTRVQEGKLRCESPQEAAELKILLLTRTTSNIGAWYVCTMYKTGKAAHIAQERQSYKLAFLAEQYVHKQDAPALVQDNHWYTPDMRRKERPTLRE